MNVSIQNYDLPLKRVNRILIQVLVFILSNLENRFSKYIYDKKLPVFCFFT